MIKIQKYNPEFKLLWDNFVKSSKNGTFLFMRDFMEYHKERFEDFSLVCFYKEKLVALLPANIQGEQVFSHQGLTYGGLVVSQDMKMEVFIEVIIQLLQFMLKEGVELLRIKNLPRVYENFASDEFLYLQFLLKSKLVRRDVSSVIDMQNHFSFSTLRKRGIKKGQKKKLKILEVEDLAPFWDEVLIPNLKERHQLSPVHSAKEITLLKNNFPNKIRQFNVYDGDVLVAGTTIFETNQVAHAQYISVINSDKNSGSLDCLFDYLIHTVFKDKKYFDFGVSNENNSLNLNKGLLYWKESFGARTSVYETFEVNPKNYTNLLNVFI